MGTLGGFPNPPATSSAEQSSAPLTRSLFLLAELGGVDDANTGGRREVKLGLREMAVHLDIGEGQVVEVPLPVGDDALPDIEGLRIDDEEDAFDLRLRHLG